METLNLTLYQVIQRIESENKRSRKFLYPSSFSKVTSECEQRMVGDHLGVLHAECRPMVDKEIHNDLANMYRLLKAIQGAQQVLLDQVSFLYAIRFSFSFNKLTNQAFYWTFSRTLNQLELAKP